MEYRARVAHFTDIPMTQTSLHDLVIIGGGPAGVAAGVYAARKQMRTVIITDHFGGQSTVSATVENWIGDISLTGMELAAKLEAHLRAQEDIEIIQPGRAGTITRGADGTFTVPVEGRDALQTRAVLVVSGARHRHLEVPGEEQYKGRGVVYCSTCDAPLFRGKAVAVVGTGNSGLEAVEDLLPYTDQITLMSNNDRITGDPVTFDRIMASGKVTVLYNAQTTAITGETFVTALSYTDAQTGEEKQLPVAGVFVQIGVLPNSDVVKDLVTLDPYGQIIVDGKTLATDVPGIYAAGDVTDVPYRQNNIAAGDAVKAVLAIHDWLKK